MPWPTAHAKPLALPPIIVLRKTTARDGPGDVAPRMNITAAAEIAVMSTTHPAWSQT